MMDWQPIETAPVNTWLLLWWRPRLDPKYPHPPEYASQLSNNKFAEHCVVGQVMWHDGMWDGEQRPTIWWNGQRQEEQDIWHVTHWMPLPEPPK